MAVAKHICSQINLPLCKVLNIEETRYSAFQKNYTDLSISSPYSLALLLISILCGMRMITHVDSLYSSIGRNEMKTFFFLYVVSNFLNIFTLCLDKYFVGMSYNFLTVLQACFQTTTFFALFASSFCIEKIYGIFGMKSHEFMSALTFVFFGVVTIFSTIFSLLAIKELITILIMLEIFFVILYICIQANYLKKTDGEIWGYGVLLTTFAFFVLSKIHEFLAGELVADLSERNIDNMFLNIMYTLLVVMMCHKFWLTTYDFELECLSLPV